ncbi:MAG: patatin-like phospholipase family protein [Hyphomicrobiaceae bacterium]
MAAERQGEGPTDDASGETPAGGQRPPAAPQVRHSTACTPEQIAARGSRKPVNLALQGGGAHGAFSWGVLDKLLEDDRLALDAVSATSAGAMNAVAMAYGISVGGREGARAKLDEFWREVSRSGALWSPIRSMPWDSWVGSSPFGTGTSAAYQWFSAMTNMVSPYQFNPLGINPLKEVLERVIDFQRLRDCRQATRLFISATNVRTGKIRVFENGEIGVEAVLASACLPMLFQAVEVDGEHFWDGGYMGNPAIFPLIYRGASTDVVIVHTNPIVRDGVPTTSGEILDRMNEISFNSSLMREMRAIAFVSRLLEAETLDRERYARMFIHAIRNDAAMARYGLESKLDLDWSFLQRLRELGRSTAAQWLEQHFDDVGTRGSVDLAATYL